MSGKTEDGQKEEKRQVHELVKKEWFKNKYFRILIGLIGGSIMGVLYWEFIGCNGGSCPITSNPYRTVLFFSAIGALMSWDNKK